MARYESHRVRKSGAGDHGQEISSGRSGEEPSAGDKARQFVEMADHIGKRVRAAENAVAVTQQELCLFFRVALFFLDHEERCFMRVAEDREQRDTIDMVQRIVTPFAGRDARAVGGQYLAEFGPGEIKLTAKFFWNGHA